METILAVLIGAVVVVLLVGITLFLYDEDRKARGPGGWFVNTTSKPPVSEFRPSRPVAAKRERHPEPPAGVVPKPLLSVDAARFSEEWRNVQRRAIIDPKSAIADADRLAGEVMRARGYGTQPSKGPAGLSEAHPVLAANYRRAHDIAQANEHGNAGSEELRQALTYYRALFIELLDTEEAIAIHA